LTWTLFTGQENKGGGYRQKLSLRGGPKEKGVSFTDAGRRNPRGGKPTTDSPLNFNRAGGGGGGGLTSSSKKESEKNKTGAKKKKGKERQEEQVVYAQGK